MMMYTRDNYDCLILHCRRLHEESSVERSECHISGEMIDPGISSDVNNALENVLIDNSTGSLV